jgi:hypothetical protein
MCIILKDGLLAALSRPVNSEKEEQIQFNH